LYTWDAHVFVFSCLRRHSNASNALGNNFLSVQQQVDGEFAQYRAEKIQRSGNHKPSPHFINHVTELTASFIVVDFLVMSAAAERKELRPH